MIISLLGFDVQAKHNLAVHLAKKIVARGHHVAFVKEPGSRIGRAIYGLLQQGGMLPRTEFLIGAAAKVQFIEESIIPATENGLITIVDEALDITQLYHSFVPELSRHAVTVLNEFINYQPDLCVWIDGPPLQGIRNTIAFYQEPRPAIDHSIQFTLEQLRYHYLALADSKANWIALMENDTMPSVERVWTQLAPLLR